MGPSGLFLLCSEPLNTAKSGLYEGYTLRLRDGFFASAPKSLEIRPDLVYNGWNSRFFALNLGGVMGEGIQEVRGRCARVVWAPGIPVSEVSSVFPG